MNWKRALKEYHNYLVLEKALANNSIEAYMRDLRKLEVFCHEDLKINDCCLVNVKTLRDFIIFLNLTDYSSKSQARIISAIKSFFNYLCIEKIIKTNPCDEIDRPKIEKKLPETLSPDEIKERCQHGHNRDDVGGALAWSSDDIIKFYGVFFFDRVELIEMIRSKISDATEILHR